MAELKFEPHRQPDTKEGHCSYTTHTPYTTQTLHYTHTTYTLHKHCTILHSTHTLHYTTLHTILHITHTLHIYYTIHYTTHIYTHTHVHTYTPSYYTTLHMTPTHYNTYTLHRYHTAHTLHYTTYYILHYIHSTQTLDYTQHTLYYIPHYIHNTQHRHYTLYYIHYIHIHFITYTTHNPLHYTLQKHTPLPPSKSPTKSISKLPIVACTLILSTSFSPTICLSSSATRILLLLFIFTQGFFSKKGRDREKHHSERDISMGCLPHVSQACNWYVPLTGLEPGPFNPRANTLPIEQNQLECS